VVIIAGNLPEYQIKTYLKHKTWLKKVTETLGGAGLLVEFS
jgi:hypothetical protein